MEQYKRRNFTTESLNTQICGINQPWLRSLLHKGRTCMKGPSFWCSASSSVKYWLELKWIKNIRLEINWSQYIYVTENQNFSQQMEEEELFPIYIYIYTYQHQNCFSCLCLVNWPFGMQVLKTDCTY